MVSTRVGNVAELPSGHMSEVSIEDTTVALCNVDDRIYAISGSCPHRGAPLAMGALHGHTVVCPWHAWEFDCRTGQGLFGDVLTYIARVEDGVIYVDA